MLFSKWGLQPDFLKTVFHFILFFCRKNRAQNQLSHLPADAQVTLSRKTFSSLWNWSVVKPSPLQIRILLSVVQLKAAQISLQKESSTLSWVMMSRYCLQLILLRNKKWLQLCLWRSLGIFWKRVNRPLIQQSQVCKNLLLLKLWNRYNSHQCMPKLLFYDIVSFRWFMGWLLSVSD